MNMVWAAIDGSNMDFELLRSLNDISYRKLPRQRISEYVAGLYAGVNCRFVSPTVWALCLSSFFIFFFPMVFYRRQLTLV